MKKRLLIGLKTRSIAALTALFMLCTMIGTVPVAASNVNTAEIIMAGSWGEFFYQPQRVTISGDTAETYGYEDKSGIVSALDAVVYMHHDLYGDNFTANPNDYLVVEDGTFISKVNGVDTSAVSFMTNGRTPNNGVFNDIYGSYNAYSINEAPLADGDVFEFFMYLDTSFYADEYSFFDKYSAEVSVGEPLGLSLNSFVAMFGAYKEEDIAENTSELPEVEIYAEEKVVGTTDAEGKVTVVFDKPGEYILYTNESEYEYVPAFCIVNVVSVAPLVVAQNIAGGITAPYADWEIADLVAYGSAPKLSDSEINEMIAAADAAESITVTERLAIELTALGQDVTKLKASGGKDLNLIEKISSIKADDIAYVSEAIYALIAYDSGNYTVKSGTDRDALIDKILDMRNADGIYGYEWGGEQFDDYDSTAMALQALAPYADRRDVKQAVDTMLEKFSAVQGESGSWGSVNTDAMVICGLAALGINIDEDERFIKNSSTAIDGLMSYVVSDLNGFWFSTVDEINALATEQGFRALAAYLGAVQNDGIFSVYQFNDFSEPAEMITVEFEVYGDKVHGSKAHSGSYPVWIKDRKVEVEDGSSVMELVCSILDEEGYKYVGSDKGYISSITSPEGVELEEQCNGKYSGWLYEVNGDETDVGMADYKLKNGDEIRLYFTDDWRKTYNPDKRPGGSAPGIPDTSGSGITIPNTDDDKEDENGSTDGKDSFNDVPKDYWAYDYINILAKLGIITGYENGEYLPENNITRAELCVILSRCANEEEITASYKFDDVDETVWYAPYVSWAAEAGIVNGVGENRFEPDEQVSRQDLCIMVVRCANLLGIELGGTAETAFGDASDIDDYAREAVELLSRSGIVSGDENANFNPKASATRAEIAKIVCGIIQ